MVLFAIIDPVGSMPVFLDMHSKNKSISPSKVFFYSLFIFIAFLYVGGWILQLFHVERSSFAVAGAIVLFIISIEMLLGVELFKNDSPEGGSTLYPVVFPLIAGPGSLTALLSMSAEYSHLNIIIAIVLNMIIIFFALKSLDKIYKWLNGGMVYVLRKFFGVILMALSIQLFTSNLQAFISTIVSK
jgi:multiple antibiotic resistance protein